MAEKKNKTQAQKAAEESKRKKAAAAPKQKTPAPKEIKSDEKSPEATIPVRVISSLVCIGLFVVMLVALALPEGILIKFVGDLVRGLVGQAGFVILVPTLFCLFLIHAFSGKEPVKMRTVSLLIFVLACGCVTHLSLPGRDIPITGTIVPDLYNGGVEGTTGGVICGGIAILIKLGLGSLLSYIIFIVTALLTLLAGMKITIASVVRAFQNRPRPEWEEEDVTAKPEPASIVVNHISNRRIARMERKRSRPATPEEPYEAEENEDAHVEAQKPAEGIQESDRANKRNAMMQQIEADVDEPVVAAGDKPAAPAVTDPEIIPVTNKKKETPSRSMPPLEVVPKNERKSIDVDPALQAEPAVQPVAEPEPEPTPEAIAELKKEKVTAAAAEKAAAQVAMEIAQSASEEKQDYSFPPISLLKLPPAGSADGSAEMLENSRRLEETLASFKIEAHIINVTRGPSVTRYEVELEKGVRLNKLTSAADDIALSLGASGVRIAAIPGKISVVGIEVPNIAVTTVSLREVIDSQEFSKAKSKSAFAVGKDIGGACIVGNIAKLPHMLIAGTTGSGKSVCMNSLIVSLLYKASPDDVKLIMVDPKMVELGIYNGIPHLLIPVVTDPKKAAGSLQWAVTEMMRRYKAMSDAGVRDLESYNGIIESQEVDGNKLPQVVVIIDELADLMLVAAKEVEESICRIAQMGRAAGIHLVIATQRPSADVITGLMKANIPSRIAFAVASAMESRIILDTQGAEKLVGKGDMLYAPIGNGKPRRVQGCFVTDDEVEAVTTYVKDNYVTNYDEQVLEEIEKKAAQTGNQKSGSEVEATSEEAAGDEMLPAAVEVIFETGQASVSMLQRRLKLGYSRAARIVDEMEDKGIVGPFMGAKPREILITREQWEAMRTGQSEQLGFEDLSDQPPFDPEAPIKDSDDN